MDARASFSTCRNQIISPIPNIQPMSPGRDIDLTYRDLEIYKLLRKGTHLVVKAEAVLSSLCSREHKITLSFLLSIHYDLIIWSYHLVIDIERSSCLDLYVRMYISVNPMAGTTTSPDPPLSTMAFHFARKRLTQAAPVHYLFHSSGRRSWWTGGLSRVVYLRRNRKQSSRLAYRPPRRSMPSH
jgi:hypothetical protein